MPNLQFGSVPGFPVKKPSVSGYRSGPTSCHSGKNQKTCPRETWPRENAERDEYFLTNPCSEKNKEVLIKTQILNQLKEIEQHHQVKIIYACESGSRAWGFPSKDSDYDVRFIYIHEKDWYLSIAEKKDVIEAPPDKVLDISGWDIRKSFALLRRSNLSLLEWLYSPVVYASDDAALLPMKKLSEKAFLPVSACHHYLSMSKNMTDNIASSSAVRIKSYLYALRSVLCAKWICDNCSMPPVLFHPLKEKYLPSGAVRDEADHLLASRSNTYEKDTIDRLPELENYLRRESETVSERMPKNPRKCDIELFDQAFRKTIEIVSLSKSCHS
jgi:predicted nucleotidyltransferase